MLSEVLVLHVVYACRGLEPSAERGVGLANLCISLAWCHLDLRPPREVGSEVRLPLALTIASMVTIVSIVNMARKHSQYSEHDT